MDKSQSRMKKPAERSVQKVTFKRGFPGGSVVKNSPANAGAGIAGSVLGLGRSPGGGNGNPLQYSCQDNPMDRGAQWVHGVAKSWARLSTHTTFNIWGCKNGKNTL